MLLSGSIANGNHTGGTLLELAQNVLGPAEVTRIVVSITGNTADARVGIYSAAAGLGSLSAAVMEAGEVYSNSTVVAVAAGGQEINATGNPIPVSMSGGKSLYLLFVANAADAATSLETTIYLG
jgi:hypothetical protein